MSRKTQFEVHSAGGQRHQLQPILLEVEVHLKFRFAAGSEEQVPLQSHADGRRNHPDGSSETMQISINQHMHKVTTGGRRLCSDVRLKGWLFRSSPRPFEYPKQECLGDPKGLTSPSSSLPLLHAGKSLDH